MKTLILTAVLMSTAAYADAPAPGPFGFHEGMTAVELKKLGAVPKEGRLVMATAPKHHPAFEYYLLVVSPTVGLCKVIATGKTIEDSGYGSEVRREFESLRKGLTSRYGEPERVFDFLEDGSIWHESNEWMTAVYKKERILAAFWKNTEPLNSIHASIVLQVNGLRRDKAYVDVVVEFSNFRACRAEYDATVNSAF